MCSENDSKWKKDAKYYGLFGITTYQNKTGDMVIHGKINNQLEKLLNKIRIKLKYWASNPPTNCSSFAGSGLPYPNEEIAYQNTPNQGVIELYDINFSLNLQKPNSYYKNLGKTFIKPHLNLMFIDGNNKAIGGVYKIPVSGYYPYRTLSIPKQIDNIMAYSNPNLPIRTQEQILRDSRYPSHTMKEYSHFWGLRPSP